MRSSLSKRDYATVVPVYHHNAIGLNRYRSDGLSNVSNPQRSSPSGVVHCIGLVFHTWPYIAGCDIHAGAKPVDDNPHPFEVRKCFLKLVERNEYVRFTFGSMYVEGHLVPALQYATAGGCTRDFVFLAACRKRTPLNLAAA